MAVVSRQGKWLFATLTMLSLSVCNCADQTGAKDLVFSEQGLIRGVELSGSTQDDSAVKVKNVADEDGRDDRHWQVDFLLNGGDGANSLPVDTGEKNQLFFELKSIRASDGQVLKKRLTITLFDELSEKVTAP